MTEILFKDLSYVIISAAMEVHRMLGPGFLESVYQASLANEFKLRDIPIEEQVCIPVSYKDRPVGGFVADFVIERKIILELKAVTELHDAHRAQAINYLAATD